MHYYYNIEKAEENKIITKKEIEFKNSDDETEIKIKDPEDNNSIGDDFANNYFEDHNDESENFKLDLENVMKNMKNLNELMNLNNFEGLNEVKDLDEQDLKKLKQTNDLFKAAKKIFKIVKKYYGRSQEIFKKYSRTA